MSGLQSYSNLGIAPNGGAVPLVQQSGTGTLWTRVFLWLTLSLSSFVIVEPSPYDILTIALLFSLFLTGLRVPRAISTGLLLLAIYLLGNCLGAVASDFGEDVIRSLSIRVYLVLSFVLFASLIATHSEATMRAIWSGYAFAAFFAVLYAIGQYYGVLPDEGRGGTLRATALFKDANVYGPFLVPIALLFLSRLLNTKKVWFLLNSGAFVVILVGMLLAFSRGAFMNLFAACGLFALFAIRDMPSHRDQMKFVLLMIVVAFLGTIALYYVVSDTAAGHMFAQRSSLVQAYDVSANGRFATQIAAIQEIGTDPIGMGPGLSRFAFEGLHQPHNVFLTIGTEAGWLGMAGFLLFILLSLWRGASALKTIDPSMRRHLQIVLASVAGVTLQSLFIDSTHWRHYWLLLGVLWGLTAIRSVRQGAAQNA